MLRKFQKQFQRRGFFGAIAGPKRLLFARACGLLLKKSSSAYALLTRNLAIVGGNYNQKNRTIKKTHKETIVEGTTGRFQLMKWFHQYYKYFAASVEYPLSNVISYANSPTSQNPHVKPNQNLNTSLTLICTCHTCAYAQCLRSTFLTKPLTPPCANQGFAYAKCSYDKALIKTIQNGFWGRSFDNYETL